MLFTNIKPDLGTMFMNLQSTASDSLINTGSEKAFPNDAFQGEETH